MKKLDFFDKINIYMNATYRVDGTTPFNGKTAGDLSATEFKKVREVVLWMKEDYQEYRAKVYKEVCDKLEDIIKKIKNKKGKVVIY